MRTDTAPAFLVSLSLSNGRSTGDDIADALEQVAREMRDLEGGPVSVTLDAYDGRIALEGDHVGMWAVSGLAAESPTAFAVRETLAMSLYAVAYPVGIAWANADSETRANYFADAADVLAIMPHLLPHANAFCGECGGRSNLVRQRDTEICTVCIALLEAADSAV